MHSVLDQAKREAKILEDNGAHGIIVENFGDVPFRIGLVDPETVAAMTLAVNTVRRGSNLPVGINMLRNDARSALGVAAVTGAAFIRVNVHYGVMAAEEGLVQGEAYQTLRQRKALGVDVMILADVLVKHAAPVGSTDLGQMARETTLRGLADGLIVSGTATGVPTDVQDVETVRDAVPDGFILVGSGVDETNVRQLLDYADAVIVGTSLKVDGVVGHPLDPDRVKRMADLVRGFG